MLAPAPARASEAAAAVPHTQRLSVARVVALGRDPRTTRVSEVMTPQPTVIRAGDAAELALETMTKGRFRHLPVVARGAAPSGQYAASSVVGLLDVVELFRGAAAAAAAAAAPVAAAATTAAAPATQHGATAGAGASWYRAAESAVAVGAKLRSAWRTFVSDVAEVARAGLAELDVDDEDDSVPETVATDAAPAPASPVVAAADVDGDHVSPAPAVEERAVAPAVLPADIARAFKAVLTIEQRAHERAVVSRFDDAVAIYGRAIARLPAVPHSREGVRALPAALAEGWRSVAVSCSSSGARSYVCVMPIDAAHVCVRCGVQAVRCRLLQRRASVFAVNTSATEAIQDFTAALAAADEWAAMQAGAHVDGADDDVDSELAAIDAVALPPHARPRMLAALTEALVESGRYVEAAEHVRRDPAASHELVRAARSLMAAEARRIKDAGGELYREGRFTEALPCYSRALTARGCAAQLDDGGDASPREESVLLSNRASCHEQVGDVARAVEDARLAVAKDATYVKAHAKLARLLLQSGDRAAAFAAANAGLAAARGEPSTDESVVSLRRTLAQADERDADVENSMRGAAAPAKPGKGAKHAAAKQVDKSAKHKAAQQAARELGALFANLPQ